MNVSNLYFGTNALDGDLWVKNECAAKLRVAAAIEAAKLAALK